ncbi:MAG: hypothetical protein WCJ30_03325 [Deltaproteobacteria bacterium]
MPLRHAFAALLVALGIIAGCSSSVRPGDAGHDAPADVPAADGSMACVLPDGTLCPAGASCPATDGCNTCACPATGGSPICTLRACAHTCHASSECGARQVCVYHAPGCGTTGVCEAEVLCDGISPFCACDGTTHIGPCNGPDAPYARDTACGCRSNADCTAPNTECEFAPGCAAPNGECRPVQFCGVPNPFCGCDGMTYLSCGPNQPFIAPGACPVVGDAGTATDCDPAHAACAMPTPVCPDGAVPSVVGGCWGPCVPFPTCAPIPCDPTAPSRCPACTACDPSGVCRNQCGL